MKVFLSFLKFRIFFKIATKILFPPYSLQNFTFFVQIISNFSPSALFFASSWKACEVFYMESELSINLSYFAAALDFMSLFTVTKRLKYFLPA